MKALTQVGIRSAQRRAPLSGGRSGSATGRLRRAGFTLVEMMIVIVIIGILAGLLVPAVMKARITANEARVINEINSLGQAITAFKAKYGVEPPSRFNLYLTQAGWNSDPVSMGIVKRIWPNFDFTMGQGAGVAYPAFWSSIATGANPGLGMDPSESMFFFLGGVVAIQGQGQVPTGFSKNPAYPFAPVSGTANTNREGPFFEFTDVSRIKDYDNDGLNEWYDSLPNQTRPFLYFSSYEGSGYRMVELTWVTASGTFTPLNDVYRVSSTAGVLPPASPSAAFPGSPLDSRSLTGQKSTSFQIISPGYDGQYGSGGVFNANLPNSGLLTPLGDPDTVAFDNLTNFNGGRLKP